MIEEEIKLTSSTNLSVHDYFHIILATGCEDVDVPYGALFKRTDSGAVVSCRNMDSHWFLTCQDNQWKGIIGNCTTKEESENIEQIISVEKDNATRELPYGT